jgi:hypothetical protein
MYFEFTKYSVNYSITFFLLLVKSISLAIFFSVITRDHMIASICLKILPVFMVVQIVHLSKMFMTAVGKTIKA